MSQRLSDSSWLTFIDLASGFFLPPLVEADRHKTALPDEFGQLWDSVRCALDLDILPYTATMCTELLGHLKNNGVKNGIDDIYFTAQTSIGMLPS